MAWAQIGATDIHYQQSGSGPPLLFLHGFGSCGEAWHQQADAFKDRFRVIAYDSVNHGHSSNSPTDEPEQDRADELEGLLNHLGIDRPILAGNSMGALTILRWASRNPDRALALIPSGMGIAAPAGPGGSQEDTMPAATRRALFEPVGDEVLFLPAEGGFTKEFP